MITRIKPEKSVELSPDNMPYHELIIVDREPIKIEQNTQEKIDKKLTHPWNTKQY